MSKFHKLAIMQKKKAVLTYFDIFRSKMLLAGINSVLLNLFPEIGIHVSSFLFCLAILLAIFCAPRLLPKATSKYRSPSFSSRNHNQTRSNYRRALPKKIFLKKFRVNRSFKQRKTSEITHCIFSSLMPY